MKRHITNSNTEIKISIVDDSDVLSILPLKIPVMRTRYGITLDITDVIDFIERETLTKLSETFDLSKRKNLYPSMKIQPMNLSHNEDEFEDHLNTKSNFDNSIQILYSDLKGEKTGIKNNDSTKIRSINISLEDEKQIEDDVKEKLWFGPGKNTEQMPHELKNIWIRDKVLDRIYQNSSTINNESTYGVLLGNICESQDNGMEVIVLAAIQARNMDKELTSTKFSSQVWEVIADLIKANPIYLNDHIWRIIGWYHLQPEMGVFMSANSRAFHKKFFTHPVHLALIIDPESKMQGWFGWDITHKELVNVPMNKVEQKSDDFLLQRFDHLTKLFSSGILDKE